MFPALLTFLAMLAFAANSVLCRLALGDGAIDAPRFTAVRIVAGALVLVTLARARSQEASLEGNWRQPASLFVYALGFSLAYVSLDTGTGALILFGAVQGTMIGAGVLRGERPTGRQQLGIALGLGGLVALLLPGASAPSPWGAAAMAVAGVGWGLFSLLGQGVSDPIASTARAFLWATPVALLVALPGMGEAVVSARGVGLAATSGAITSGLGYAIWVAALRGHSATSAAVVQLSVPVLAGLGGWLLLSEPLTGRFVAAGGVTLVGVALTVRRATEVR